MTWADLVIAVVLIGVLPIRGIMARRELQRRLASGHPHARIWQYAWAIVTQWVLTLIVLVFWSRTS